MIYHDFDEYMKWKQDGVKVVKLGGVELYEPEAAENLGDYIVTYSKVYRVCHNEKRGYYAKLVYTHKPTGSIGLMKRGRFTIMPLERVNRSFSLNLTNDAMN